MVAVRRPLIAQFSGNDETEKPWRVLILEDTGELLTPDAKTMIGQGLSRFLNLVDGLIGQGLRVLVLVTTNEPIRALHPAVARPGRCAANIEFQPLSPEEASNWLERHEHETRVDSPITLASVYAFLEGEEAIAAVQSAGFAGR
jgi:ATP-dependent 26S proteasome regulatory subunit